MGSIFVSDGPDFRAKRAGDGKKRKRRSEKLSEEETGSRSLRGAKPAEGSEEIL